MKHKTSAMERIISEQKDESDEEGDINRPRRRKVSRN